MSFSSTSTFINAITSAAASTTATASPSCITTTPDKNGHVPITDCRAIWIYNPSIAAAVTLSILFGLTTAIHIIQARIYRKSFCWVIIMAGIWETTGFILRIISATHQLLLKIYIPEELLILLAPIWINAFDYMLLGRMVYFFLPEQKVLGINAIRFARYFVAADIACFFIQAIGGSILSQGANESTQKIHLGLHIYMAGVGIQECFILFFATLAIVFHRRMIELEREGTLELKGQLSWRPLLYTLYASITLISVRIIYRLVQYASGFLSTIPTHEAYFYCLEALPMFIALLIMNITHPGRTLIGPDSEFPSRKQRKEEQRIKKEQKRTEREQKRQMNPSSVV
jgi:RTA1 like protein